MRKKQFLPLRAVHPTGWLSDFLHTQASGLTGNPQAAGYPYGIKFWGSVNEDTGPYASWWPFEQTAYWIDAALKCGFLIGDETLYNRALSEIETALDQADSDGFIGPEFMRAKDRWPHAVFFRAVIAQYEISGDERYLEALERHYRALPHPMDWDRDVTGVEILLYLYQATGEVEFLQAAEDLYARFNARFPDHDCSIESLESEKRAGEHGVTFNEIAKLPVLLYLATGNERYLQAAVNGYAKLDRDQLLADGLHSCSEHLRGRDPLDSHEACDITDHTWALGYLLLATGEVNYADRIEKIIFNALPGSITKDFKALQYFSCPNQVIATHNSNHNRFQRGYNWMSFRPDHEVQCCPGNIQRALPNYAARQWAKGGEGDLVALLYGPSNLQAVVHETQVTIEEITDYPASEKIEFVFHPAKPVAFGFSLRIPGWCRRARLSLNGEPQTMVCKPGTLVTFEREWIPGDRLVLEVPFELALQRFPKGGASIDYGPLTMSLPVQAHIEPETGDSSEDQRRHKLGKAYKPSPHSAPAGFPAWELTPASRWNYTLCVDEQSLPGLARVQWHGLGSALFDPDHPFVTLRVPALQVDGWELVEKDGTVQNAWYAVRGSWKVGPRRLQGHFTFTPPLPSRRGFRSRLSEEVEWIELVPYGNTLLRMTVFPI